MGFYSIGVGALNAAQIGLATTGHNITNVNTDGYHRQVSVQSTAMPLLTGAGFIGQGVQVDTIKRVYDQFLDGQLQQAQTQGSYLDTYLSNVQQIDNMVADPNSGLSPALQDFFSAVSDVASNPQSVPARQQLLSGASALVSRFQSISQRFDEMRGAVNGRIADSVGVINAYAQQIAKLNDQIALQTGSTSQPANDMLDQRENLISQLGQQVRATAIKQSDGGYNIYIGNGQPLVVSKQVYTLTAVPAPDDPARTDVAYHYSTGNTLLGKDSISGGILGGLLAFREDSLDPAQNALGRVAMGLAKDYNDQHRLGQDLTGSLGSAFFTAPSPAVTNNSANTGSGVLSATLANAQNITVSDYQLTYTGTVGAEYELTRLTDSAQTTITAAQLSAGYTVDGVTYQLSSGTPAAKDSFTIQPTRDAASEIGLNPGVTTSSIAAAAPIITAATLANTGSGKISAGIVNAPNDKVSLTFTSATTFDVLDNTTGATLASGVGYTPGGNISYNGWTAQISGAPAATGDKFEMEGGVARKTVSGSTTSIGEAVVAVNPNANLKQPVTITFTSATTFNVSGTGTGNPTGLTYNPATGASISYNGWSVTLTGHPANGDQFSIGPNTVGVPDNRNMLLLAKMQTQNTLAGGTTSFQGGYAQMVAKVGSQTSEIKVTSAAQQNLIQQTQQSQQSLSGVNLDEEAANLLRYQQAYQAAGKMLQIAASLFDNLLAIGR